MVSQYVLVLSPLWNFWPDITSCQNIAVFFLWGTLSDERTGLQFAVQWSKLHRTHNCTLLSHLRLPQPGGPGSHIYITQEHAGPVIPLKVAYMSILKISYNRNLILCGQEFLWTRKFIRDWDRPFSLYELGPEWKWIIVSLKKKYTDPSTMLREACAKWNIFQCACVARAILFTTHNLIWCYIIA
jgi:hypothetical protein